MRSQAAQPSPINTRSHRGLVLIGLVVDPGVVWIDGWASMGSELGGRGWTWGRDRIAWSQGKLNGLAGWALGGEERFGTTHEHTR